MISILALVIVITIIGLAYIVSPIDLLPDVIPILGWADDAFVGFIILMAWLLWFFVEFVANFWWFLLVVLGLIGLYILIRVKKWLK